MSYNIDSIASPRQEDLIPEQVNLLENYRHIYAELEKTPRDRTMINSAIKQLTKFYCLFNSVFKKKYSNWYKFQITLIDPLIGPCSKLSELITECNIQDKIAITEDGENIILPLKDKDFASIKFLKLLNQQFPKLKINTIKL